MGPNLRSLIGKLNDPTRTALEAAAGLCLTRNQYEVEIEHFLLKLMDRTDNDLACILKEFGVDRSRLSAELNRSLDSLKSGNARTPRLGADLLKMMTEAWTIGSINYGAGAVRGGFAVLALISTPELTRTLGEFSREFRKVEPERLARDFSRIVSVSAEGDLAAGAEEAAETGMPAPGAGGAKFLDQYTQNLTEAARSGRIDPVLSRDEEIRQVVDVLTRRRQNNPILVGEAGVGKTAVVEGFAMRVANKEVPRALQNIVVRALDLALLQAGAGVKGEFENRLKGLIDEVKASPAPIVLFIDEAHTMIGAGGSAGQNDAANILKPALARGELRTIAATTWSEYKRYFEKDAALSRRFQPVKVDEPDEARCQVMIRGLVPSLESHHQVRVMDEGVAAAVALSARYLPDRQLPDKAVSVLDTACARLFLGQNAVPPEVEDTRRSLDDIEVQTRILVRESAVGVDHAERLSELEERKKATEDRLGALDKRWETEQGLVKRIRELRARLESATIGGVRHSNPVGSAAGGASAGSAPDPVQMREQLQRLNAELDEVQGESPLIRVCVDSQVVGEVVSNWTGIPVGKMLKDELRTVLELESHLARRVVGQDHAMQAISQRIRTARARLDDPRKPVGVFMLVGPSGVGKTETALALADLLFGGERNMITINMSEFQEAHTVSALKGSPPGYVGYGEGGVLTEAVRRRPYSVVLLDEIEKAHPDVRELFFQVFDKGTMEDGEGRQIDFKNAIIILTSNAGTDTLMRLAGGGDTVPPAGSILQALKPELNSIFKPAFLGRLVIVPYYPLRDEVLKQIIVLKLAKIQNRLAETHRVGLTYDAGLVEAVAQRCTEVESGARNVDNILTHTLLPDISRELLAEAASGGQPRSIRVSLAEDGAFAYQLGHDSTNQSG